MHDETLTLFDNERHMKVNNTNYVQVVS